MEPREALTAERADVLARLHSAGAVFDDIVAATRDSNSDDEHDPEGTTIAAERSLAAALATHERARLAEIDAAFARLDDGTYGTCVQCGQPISAGRLAARPAAAKCIECA